MYMGMLIAGASDCALRQYQYGWHCTCTARLQRPPIEKDTGNLNCILYMKYANHHLPVNNAKLDHKKKAAKPKNGHDVDAGLQSSGVGEAALLR